MRLLLRSEDGFTIVELTAALSILAIGFFSLAGAMGLGFREVALGRQRQSATEIANGRLEHLRNLPFGAVALSTQPSHATNPDHPDHAISVDGTTYDPPGTPGAESLIVDTVEGQVLHFEDPVQVGATEMKIYQYVTWADDASATEPYKRITILVEFKTPSVNGVSRIVSASAFVTTGAVNVGGTASGPNQGGSPTPTPTPSPSPSGSCSGDVDAPTGDFAIASGTGSETGYTASATVSLEASLSDACAPVTGRFSNDGSTFGEEVTLATSPTTVSWALTSGDGTKSVSGRFKDGAGNERTTGPYTIVLDTQKPSVPGTLSHTRSCQGNDRTVNLSWGASTDTNLSGYRVYRSINQGAWEAVATASTTSASNTHLKTLDSVRFYVVGYDKAGNESDATNTISLSKNQC